MKSSQVNIVLEELKKTLQILENFRNSDLPEIEKDIILSKIREIYEMLKFSEIRSFREPAAKNIEAFQLEETVMERFAPDIEEEPVIETVNEPVTEHPAPEPKTEQKIEFVKEPEPQPEPEITLDEPVIEPVEEFQSIPETHPVKKSAKKEILAEKFQKQGFLNEALAQYQNMMDLSKKLQNQPIKDISSAISFNEKFLFIKELFDNDGTLYQRTMTKINNADGFNDAIRYLDENFSWDFNDPQVQKLLELVRRRYLNQ